MSIFQRTINFNPLAAAQLIRPIDFAGAIQRGETLALKKAQAVAETRKLNADLDLLDELGPIQVARAKRELELIQSESTIQRAESGAVLVREQARSLKNDNDQEVVWQQQANLYNEVGNQDRMDMEASFSRGDIEGVLSARQRLLSTPGMSSMDNNPFLNSKANGLGPGQILSKLLQNEETAVRIRSIEKDIQIREDRLAGELRILAASGDISEENAERLRRAARLEEKTEEFVVEGARLDIEEQKKRIQNLVTAGGLTQSQADLVNQKLSEQRAVAPEREAAAIEEFRAVPGQIRAQQETQRLQQQNLRLEIQQKREALKLPPDLLGLGDTGPGSAADVSGQEFFDSSLDKGLQGGVAAELAGRSKAMVKASFINASASFFGEGADEAEKKRTLEDTDTGFKFRPHTDFGKILARGSTVFRDVDDIGLITVEDFSEPLKNQFSKLRITNLDDAFSARFDGRLTGLGPAEEAEMDAVSQAHIKVFSVFSPDSIYPILTVDIDPEFQNILSTSGVSGIPDVLKRRGFIRGFGLLKSAIDDVELSIDQRKAAHDILQSELTIMGFMNKISNEDLSKEMIFLREKADKIELDSISLRQGPLLNRTSFAPDLINRPDKIPTGSLGSNPLGFG